jgi:5-methyltetrahydrofolate--homocysteine methyltransferase
MPARVSPLEPVFYGTGQVLVWEAGLLLDSVDRQTFLAECRGASRGEPSNDSAAGTEPLERTFEELVAQLRSGGLVDARGYYGFFPVITDDEEFIVLDPGDFHTERATFRMSRPNGSDGRSLADYFRPEGDIVAFQAVCLGAALGKRVVELGRQAKGAERAPQLDALGACLAGQLIERTTREVRRALGIARTRGLCLNFGEPGMPPVEQLPALFELLGVEERLGLTLDGGFRVAPRHSHVGMFVHHPDVEGPGRGRTEEKTQAAEEDGHVAG